MNRKLIRPYFIFTIAATSIVGCKEASTEAKLYSPDNKATELNQLEKSHWLIGKWENKTIEGESAEIWRKENDSTYTAISYFVAENDTISNEKIRLEQRAGQLYYIPLVSGQNKNQPVRFTLTTLSDKQMIFENPEHDFPQKITYTLVTPDSLYAEISGQKKGRVSKIPFPMVRAKKS